MTRWKTPGSQVLDRVLRLSMSLTAVVLIFAPLIGYSQMECVGHLSSSASPIQIQRYNVLDDSVDEVDLGTMTKWIQSLVLTSNPKFDPIQSAEEISKSMDRVLKKLTHFQMEMKSFGIEVPITIRFFMGDSFFKLFFWDIEISGFSFLPQEMIEKSTPLGISYDVGVDRPFTNFGELTLILSWAESKTKSLIDHYSQILQIRLITTTNPESNDFEVPSAPGIYLRIKNPNDTVTLFRGDIRLSLPTVRNQILQQGMPAALTNRPYLEMVSNLSPKEKISLFIRHANLRKGGSFMGADPMMGSPSFFVGGTQDKSAAHNFYGRGYSMEIKIPRELLLDAFHFQTFNRGESEDFIPFGVHPNWIVRILGPNNTVLFDRENGVAPSSPQ